MRKPKHTFATLFSGCGGFDFGFHQSHYECIGAFDNDPIAVATYNKNYRKVGVVADLAGMSIQLDKRPDVVVAGPPCQGFSTLGKRVFEDPRNSLFVLAARIAVTWKPQVVLIENVTGILAGKMRSHFLRAEGLLLEAGYKTQVLRVCAKDFGLPQIRQRVILLAVRGVFGAIAFPKPSHCRSLGEVLSGCSGGNHDPIVLKRGSDDLRIAKKIGQNQKLCNVRGGDRSVPTWTIPEVFGKTCKSEIEVLELIRELRRRVRMRPDGDADPVSRKCIERYLGRNAIRELASLVESGYLRRVDGRFDFTHSFNGKFRRLSNRDLTPAVDTRFGQPRYFLHPDDNRGMSAREAARVQGFPDAFDFLGNKQQQFRQIGNAVPPPISSWLADEIREKILC